MKKKFKKLSKTKVPTGDPNIPFTIREAKAMRLLIIEKTKGAIGSEEEAFAAEDVDEVEEEENGDRDDDRPLQVEVAGNEGGQANDESVSGVSRGGLVSSDLLTRILDRPFPFDYISSPTFRVLLPLPILGDAVAVVECRRKTNHHSPKSC